MKLVSFTGPEGDSFGLWTQDGVVDLRREFPVATSLRDLLAAETLDSIEQKAGHAHFRHREVSLLPPIVDAGKILCVGLNYDDHRAEMTRPRVSYPTVFTRFNDSHVGHDADVRYPSPSQQLDYEGELAVVISKPTWHVAPADALEHVLGYSIYSEFSARDWQRHTSQWTPGKNFYRSGSFGPWICTRDEVPPVESLSLTTSVDSQIVQSASVADLLFDIPQLISYISTFTPLTVGDVIVTGTPGGVGMSADPPSYLRPGQIVEVSVSHIGTLRNRVGAESVPAATSDAASDAAR